MDIEVLPYFEGAICTSAEDSVCLFGVGHTENAAIMSSKSLHYFLRFRVNIPYFDSSIS